MRHPTHSDAKIPTYVLELPPVDTTGSESMIDSTEMEASRVTISIGDYPLPVGEDDRTKALEDLEEAIGGLFHGHADHASITTRAGHHYVEIGDNCPRCGGTLELREYTYCDNGAVAEANCAHAPIVIGGVGQSTGSSISKAAR